MGLCASSIDGNHCNCIDARATKICCYCRKATNIPVTDTEFDDDGSEENT